MSEIPGPDRMVVIWSPEARIELRTIDREPALQILYCVDRYLINRTSDVKRLRSPFTGFRLRCGDYRVFFDLQDENTMEITGVRHRRDAYR
jgi:mRNA-degrading endonuclease RelE of RelBE toxin-antitoxin system